MKIIAFFLAYKKFQPRWNILRSISKKTIQYPISGFSDSIGIEKLHQGIILAGNFASEEPRWPTTCFLAENFWSSESVRQDVIRVCMEGLLYLLCSKGLYGGSYYIYC